MTNAVTAMTDMLAAPMEDVIVTLGASVAQAQRELDRYSIESQKEIDADPTLSAAGVAATFYQIPKVELELTMTITMKTQPSTSSPSSTKGGSAASLPQASVLRPSRMSVAPVNAFYANQFGFQAAASSKLKLTIVPVPPAGTAA